MHDVNPPILAKSFSRQVVSGKFVNYVVLNANEQPAMSVFGHAFSWRDLVLIGGGLFLVWKATKERPARFEATVPASMN